MKPFTKSDVHWLPTEVAKNILHTIGGIPKRLLEYFDSPNSGTYTITEIKDSSEVKLDYTPDWESDDEREEVPFSHVSNFSERERESDWHRHPLGGGWVKNTASVDDEVFVGPKSVVFDEAIIKDGTSINGESIITGNVIIDGENVEIRDSYINGHAVIHGNVQVEEKSTVCDYAIISGFSRISRQSRVSQNADIRNSYLFNSFIVGTSKLLCGSYPGCFINGGIWRQRPLMINAGELIRICSPNTVKIGCEVHSVDEWIERGESIAENHSIGPKRFEQLKLCILMIKDLQSIRAEIVVGYEDDL